MKKILITMCLLLGMTFFLQAQSTTKQVSAEISSTSAKLLGNTGKVIDLIEKPRTTKEKKDALRRLKKVPDNFKGRKPGGKAVLPELEHQGPDPIRQTEISGNSSRMMNEPLVNIQGLGNFGSPHDPTGDVSDEYYVQAINITDVGVYDLEGTLVQEFAMNTLWSSANLLIAISDTKDPLGSYNAYSFSTPNFPDYPKYAITPEALVVTTNEEGAGTLHNYFLDLAALYAGAASVEMIRIGVTGSNSTEAGFYVTTPADWNGTNLPYDNRPICLAINDSSWGGVAQDQIEIYSFNLDFVNPANSTVDQTAVITTPFDSYPCSENGPGFACVPQQGGAGLDAIPEVIMNIPHLRNFGTHESMVFNFVTDVTDGNNQSGIRWVELRRTAGSEWSLYQEGTFGLDDGLDRFMGSIAMDGNGNIGLAYNVSSTASNPGIRYTGRLASDPLGEMTVEEVVVIEGASVINSGGRFGDYSQLSVSPKGDNTFWFTTEYAGNNDSATRIVAFELQQDSIDMTARAIIEPVTGADLTATENVKAEYFNSGLTSIENFQVGLIFNNSVVQTVMIDGPLAPGETYEHDFTETIDLSAEGSYSVGAVVTAANDENVFNDTLYTTILKLAAIDGGLTASFDAFACADEIPTMITLNNAGADVISSATIEVTVNGTVVDQIDYSGSISFGQSDVVEYTVVDNLVDGNNEVTLTILDINGSVDNLTGNNMATFNFELMNSGEFVTLIFNTDEYPQESQWVLSLQGTGTEVASGSFTEGNTEHIIGLCIPLDSCYTFTVTDQYGDGICCNYGEGNFSILDNEGTVLINNEGEFGDSVEQDFCPNGACLLSADVVVEDASSASTADGSIMINASNGVGPFQYSIDGGANFQGSPVFNDLLADTYEIIINTADPDCSFTTTATVGFTSGTHSVNGETVEVIIMPNPTEGVFQVRLSNLQIEEPLLNFQIFDINGKLVQQRTIGKYDNDYLGTLSLYDYPSGNYFLRIINDEVQILEKIIKL